MDDANAASSGSAPNQDKAAKDRSVAFRRGVAMGTIEAVSQSRSLALRKLIFRIVVCVPYEKR